ncbi:PRTRC system ThiF family protein [Bacteroides sp.]|jgi:PRTRC system thiF family protein|uniref:PRTRC system ThiF family protein n=1 Tax=Bacteroides sp. TaxID=29523 RepID=UPI002628F670|nr:PRTRC system ThiF family protein [Bacteroides sp.]MDD3038071.1 PRTRC system ThiF family protein [Bacteroides sp.]
MKKVHYTNAYLVQPQHRVSIHLIGAGGTGSQVLEALARMDSALARLGHPGLDVSVFDADEVSEANIGRQLFSPADIGLNKSVCLVTRINQFFGLDWMAVPEMYAEDTTTANITISCVDNVKSRMVIHRNLKVRTKIACDNYEVPFYWLDFGNTQKTGQAILGTIKKCKQPEDTEFEAIAVLPTICDLFDLTQVNEQDSGPSCSVAEALRKQDLFINSTLAQMGCALLWKLFREGKIEQQGIFLNLTTMKANPLPVGG